MSTLRDAHEYLQDKSNWAQGAYEREDPVTGERTHCAMGAVGEFAPLEEFEPAIRALKAAAFAVGCPLGVIEDMHPVAWVNDKLGYEAVLQMFEKAIVAEEGGL